MNNHALPEQKEMAMKYRNVGLGIMGLYDMLVKLGIKYGTKDSIEFVDEIMNLMFKSAFSASVTLAKEKGSFPACVPSNISKAKIVREHFTGSDLQSLGFYEHGIRNCSLLSIAPSGSIGTMLNISTGCEPAFALSYTRKTESLNGNKDKYYEVYIGVAKEYMNKYPRSPLPDYFITSADLDWHDRVNMQSALQHHVDTAISSTINLKNEITKEEIEDLYLYAWEKGLKGVTIFRDGCKRAGILTTSAPKEEQKKVSNGNQLSRGMIIKADDNCIGKKRTLTTGCGTLHCEAFFDQDTGELLETYLSKGSSGGCNNFMIGLSRMISLSARGGVDIYSIVDQLKSSGTCPSYAVRKATKNDTSLGSSCPVAIGNALIDMYKELQEELGNVQVEETKEEKAPIKDKQKKAGSLKCPECGSELGMVEGCMTCPNCGWSKCS